MVTFSLTPRFKSYQYVCSVFNACAHCALSHCAYYWICHNQQTLGRKFQIYEQMNSSMAIVKRLAAYGCPEAVFGLFAMIVCARVPACLCLCTVNFALSSFAATNCDFFHLTSCGRRTHAKRLCNALVAVEAEAGFWMWASSTVQSSSSSAYAEYARAYNFERRESWICLKGGVGGHGRGHAGLSNWMIFVINSSVYKEDNWEKINCMAFVCGFGQQS